MSRCLALAALFASCACAASYWPAKLGSYERQAVKSAPQPDAQLSEYGLQGADTADYGPFTVTALQFQDPTGAYAAVLATPGSTRVGNYLVTCEGKCPKDLPELADRSLPHVSHGAIPTLSAYFEAKGRVPHSERYIVGPASLTAAAPEIPASAAHFDYGTEGEVARYRTASGPVTLGVFSFPTPSMARQQLPQFQQIAGATAKRTGPLLVVAIGPAAAAASLISGISYQGVVEENNEPPPKPLELKPESAGQMVLSILSLAGLLLAFCLLSGLAVGGSLRLARRFGYSAAEGSLTTLHLEGK